MEIWEQIAEIARWVPTPHNTQPFRLRPITPERAQVLIHPDRMLHRSDPGNRYVTATLGIFALYLEAAARSLGWRLRCDPDMELNCAAIPPEGEPFVMADLTLVEQIPADPEALLPLRSRRTSRIPYDGRPLPEAFVAQCEALASAQGHRLRYIQERAEVRAVLHQNAIAIIDNQLRPEDFLDIKPWIRYGPTPEVGDGLWQIPFGQPQFDMRFGFALPRMLTWPGFKKLAIARYLTTQRETPAIGLLCGPFDQWPQVYAAGRLLGELWLQMAVAGIYMHPFGSLLTNPKHAAWVAERFEVDDCWFIFRCGYSVEPPASPRLQSILEGR